MDISVIEMSSQHVYVAGAWHTRTQVAAIATELEVRGCTITHRWWASEALGDAESTPEERATFAAADIQGVRDADVVLVTFLDADYAYRGTFAELGAALALQRHVVVYNPHGAALKAHTNVFYWHPGVAQRSASLDDVYAAMAQWPAHGANAVYVVDVDGDGDYNNMHVEDSVGVRGALERLIAGVPITDGVRDRDDRRNLKRVTVDYTKEVFDTADDLRRATAMYNCARSDDYDECKCRDTHLVSVASLRPYVPRTDDDDDGERDAKRARH